MRTTVYTLALILAILWGIAYFGYNFTGAIHFILVVAVFIIVFQLIRGGVSR